MEIKLWDLPTRVFHWVLVTGFLFLFYSGETGEFIELHMTVGIAVLGLLVFRLVWGVVGSTSSRFSAFVTFNPLKVLSYMKTLPSREAKQHAGHNPLGGLVVVLLLGLMIVQGVTGLFNTDDVFVDGPLYSVVSDDFADWMGGLHESVFKVLLLLVAMHVGAIIFYRIYKNTNLVKPMITGLMNWKDEGKLPVLKFKSAGLALLIFIASYGAVYGVIFLFSMS